MIVLMLLVWLLFFAIFLVVGVSEGSSVLGLISGILLLLLGLAIIVTGIQNESGYTMTIDGSEYTTEYDYTDVTLPYGTYSFVWGVIFILTSVFIIYSNGEDLL